MTAGRWTDASPRVATLTMRVSRRRHRTDQRLRRSVIPGNGLGTTRCLRITLIQHVVLRTFIRHVLSRVLCALSARGRRISEEVDAADREPALLCVGRAGFRAGAAGFRRHRLRALVTSRRADAASDAASGADGRNCLQSRHSRRVQIRRLRDRKSRSADVAVRHPALSAAASGAANRRFVRGVREDHLSGRHLARHLAAGGVVTRLSACSCCSFRNCWRDRS